MKKIINILLIIILVGVFGYTIYKHFSEEVFDVTNPYSIYSDIIEDDDNYLVVGVNNYYNDEKAKYNDNDLLIYQGQFIKFDKKLNIIKKVDYSDDDALLFPRVVKVDDGYIVMGNSVNNSMNLDTPKCLVIKLDMDLNVVKKTYLSELESSVGVEIIKDNDNIIIITRTFNKIEDSIVDQQNIIYKLDDDLNIIDKIIYKEDYLLYKIFVLGDNYLLIGDNEKDNVIVTISKDSKEILSSLNININRNNNIYLYNNKLYTCEMVYDLNTNELQKIDKENLEDNYILLIENDIIYASKREQINDDDYKENICTYDLNMNKIKEYKTDIEEINKLINYEDKFLIIGRETGEGDSIKPIIKFIEK